MAELYIPTLAPKPTTDPKTGRFLPGHVPANKGKRWDEYMGKRAQKRAAKGWKNIERYRPSTRPDNAVRSRKQVVAVMDNGRFIVLPYVGAAVQWLERHTGEHCSRENLGRCCRSNHEQKVCKHDWSKGRPKGSGHINTDHRYRGIRFYFETDFNIWKTKIKH